MQAYEGFAEIWSLQTMRMKIVLGIRAVFMAIFLVALAGKSFGLTGEFAERFLTTDLIAIYFRNWLLVEVLYWHAKYKIAIAKCGENK
ncbi:MAG: hypothetical protein NTX25_00585 [Proteobacteria bacterium]|nr:hypothetical protein [Pseudomonadota bacterium]